MTAVLRILGVLLFFALLTGASVSLFRRLFPERWERYGRRFVQAQGVLMIVGVVVWVLARGLESDTLRFVGILATALSLVTSTVLFVTMPAWGGLAVALAAWARVRPAPVDERRRAFLRQVAGTLPTAAAAGGPVGTAAALLLPVIRPVDIPVADLPPGLDGLTVLQLTDVHLGTFIDHDQVQAVVDQVRQAGHVLDLVVLTGDIADDYEKLPAALDAVASLEPRLGCWACIGNHEIYRGRAEAEAIYAKSPVTLLCDEGRVLERDGARLWLCGANDPARLGRDHRSFLEETVERSLAACPDDVGCRIVLSHRPEGFEAAARRGATLTLSGHTHGAQVAFFGRSWLEWLLPKSYLLGHYQAGSSHLYTSAGLGHWFPFRLNCPCEAALVRLVRA